MRVRWVVTYRMTNVRCDNNSIMGWIDRAAGVNNSYNTWTPNPARALLFATRTEACAAAAGICSFSGVRARRVP